MRPKQKRIYAVRNGKREYVGRCDAGIAEHMQQLNQRYRVAGSCSGLCSEHHSKEMPFVTISRDVTDLTSLVVDLVRFPRIAAASGWIVKAEVRVFFAADENLSDAEKRRRWAELTQKLCET